MPRGALALIPLLFAAVVFRSITRNFFFADDFRHLATIADRGFTGFVLMPFGDHMLIARNALFYLFRLGFGTIPESYFWAVLITHLLNVWLLFLTVQALTASSPLACFTAALWGVVPAHAGTLGWYSAYGEVVCTTLLLVVLWRLAHRSDGAEPVGTGTVLLWSVLIVVASTCIGEGIGIAAVFPLVVPLFLGWRRIGRIGWVVVACVPLVVAALYVWVMRRFDAQSANPVSSITRIVGFASAWWLVLEMLGHLLAYGTSALLLGFFGSPARYPGPIPLTATALSVVGLVLVLLRGSRRVLRQLVALVLLAAAPYVMIALGRAGLLYSFKHGSLAPAATADRYHYLSLAPLAIALALVLEHVPVPQRLFVRGATAGLTLGLGILFAGFLLFAPAIDHHDDARRVVSETLASIRSQVADSPGPISILPNPPVFVGTLAPAPVTAAIYMIYFPTNVLDGRHVLFRATPEEYRDAARVGGRLQTLLLPPQKVVGP